MMDIFVGKSEIKTALFTIRTARSAKHGLREAWYSPCETYRYRLIIEWDPKLKPLMVIGLNPSTATETQDDPTIRRCIKFAQLWGNGSLIMANLAAFRATQPTVMLQADDMFGPKNDLGQFQEMATWRPQTTVHAFRYADVLVAWGSVSKYGKRSNLLVQRAKEITAGLISVGIHPRCLGKTADGGPRHPLYVPGHISPEIY